VATPKKKKPKIPSNVIRHGGRDITLPVLSAPVGPETPALRAKHPRMNQPQDVQVIDYYLSALEAVKNLGPTSAPNDMGYGRLFHVVSAPVQWDDRATAIKALQAQIGEITDAEEKQDGLIKPNGQTLRALVDMGDLAERLLDASEGADRYIHTGIFDRDAVAAGFTREFKKHAPPGLSQLLGLIERDNYVFDIRWMAYMLGTASIETGMTFRPIREKGQGDLGVVRAAKPGKKTWHNLPVGTQRKLDYYLPVRVKRLLDGTAMVTEQDGDQFTVSADGSKIRALNGGTHGARAVNLVTNALNPAAAVYQADGGKELKYYGRGYVQITWWDNYAAAGHQLGRNLDFLLDPELVLDPVIAYRIMSVALRTGKIFAHGLNLGRFICGGHCDYFNARQMVNGNGAKEVAERSEAFERILLGARTQIMVA
jgi:hypothetical protein